MLLVILIFMIWTEEFFCERFNESQYSHKHFYLSTQQAARNGGAAPQQAQNEPAIMVWVGILIGRLLQFFLRQRWWTERAPSRQVANDCRYVYTPHQKLCPFSLSLSLWEHLYLYQLHTDDFDIPYPEEDLDLDVLELGGEFLDLTWSQRQLCFLHEHGKLSH